MQSLFFERRDVTYKPEQVSVHLRLTKNGAKFVRQTSVQILPNFIEIRHCLEGGACGPYLLIKRLL